MAIASLSAMAQEEMIGINGTYAAMVRTFSHVMNIIEKEDNYTGFVYDSSCQIFVYKNMQNEGVDKIVCLEFTKTKAEGYVKINKYRINMIRQGMKPIRYEEENGDIVYAYKNQYIGANYCHSEVVANPQRIRNERGYNYMVYSVCLPTI